MLATGMYGSETPRGVSEAGIQPSIRRCWLPPSIWRCWPGETWKASFSRKTFWSQGGDCSPATEQGPSFVSNLGKWASVLAFPEDLGFCGRKEVLSGTRPTFMRRGLGTDGNIINLQGSRTQPLGKRSGKGEGMGILSCPGASGEADLLWGRWCLPIAPFPTSINK